MKIINLNSKYELTPPQIDFTERVILHGESNYNKVDSISALMNQVPIFLLSPESMPGKSVETFFSELKPATEWLGFYKNKNNILGINKPVIGLCPERIRECVRSDDELIVLVAKVIIHEFGHAVMSLTDSKYGSADEFYSWMEEPMANVIVLEFFQNYQKFSTINNNRNIAPMIVGADLNPFDYVQGFIERQPPNYRLGLDLFDKGLRNWEIWRDNKAQIKNRNLQKSRWLKYVKTNVGRTSKQILENLFADLHTYSSLFHS